MCSEENGRKKRERGREEREKSVRLMGKGVRGKERRRRSKNLRETYPSHLMLYCLSLIITPNLASKSKPWPFVGPCALSKIKG